jgi:hypothetical protein
VNLEITPEPDENERAAIAAALAAEDAEKEEAAASSRWSTHEEPHP